MDAPDFRSDVIVLPDGRRLGFAEYGDPGAPPVFYFHGWPGSRLEARMVRLGGIRVIAPERPGYGLSDPQPQRRLADWPRDVAALADRLGLERFAVVGLSGGAPYAAVTAHVLAKRVSRLILVSGLGPREAEGMARARPGLLLTLGRTSLAHGAVFPLMRRLVHAPRFERAILAARARLPRNSRDTEALNEGFARKLIANWREAMRHSWQGPASDARIYGEPWPFRLEDLSVPVWLFHGARDDIVPVSIARHYMDRLPALQDHAIGAMEGHVSMVLSVADRIADIVRGGTAQ